MADLKNQLKLANAEIKELKRQNSLSYPVTDQSCWGLYLRELLLLGWVDYMNSQSVITQLDIMANTPTQEL